MSVAFSDQFALTDDRLRAEVRQWRFLGSFLVLAVVLGVVQALIWGRVAPGEQVLVAKDGSIYPLATVSSHLYVGIAFFGLLGLVAASVLITAAWSWRSVRGPVALLSLGLAAAVGALTAYLLGPVLAGGVVPSSVGAAENASIVNSPPAIGSALVLLFQPAVVVAVYTFLAAWQGQPELGRAGFPRR